MLGRTGSGGVQGAKRRHRAVSCDGGDSQRFESPDHDPLTSRPRSRRAQYCRPLLDPAAEQDRGSHRRAVARAQAGRVKPLIDEVKDGRMDRSIDSGLARLKDKLLLMGGYCEKAIEEATSGLTENRPERFARVHEFEKTVNQLHKEVDEDCLNLLATQSPSS